VKDSKQVFYPLIRYRDAPAAIAWLARAFGFEEQLRVPGPDGEIVHAQMRFGPGTIMLRSLRPDDADPKDPRDPQAVTPILHVAVDGVDIHYERARGAGVEITQPLEDTTHGSRGYTARDLEGHVWRFDTYRP